MTDKKKSTASVATVKPSKAVVCDITEWCATYYIKSLDKKEVEQLRNFVLGQHDICKNEAAIRGAFLSFVITDVDGNRVFTGLDGVSVIIRRNSVVIEKLLDTARGLNGDVLKNLLNIAMEKNNDSNSKPRPDIKS
ncbi:MAG: hypothetical protein MI867_12415 [Pseudomonadales bacterium]|nr:hypothetical protein [Pseudomonadales bacterium]